MNWALPVITAILACYGWYLIVQLAKRREAYDLCISLVSLIEKLGEEGRVLWQSAPEKLEQHDEFRLKLRLAELEKRLSLLQKHYRNPNKPTIITSTQIWQLRNYLTVAPMEYFPEGSSMDRGNGIIQLTSAMTSNLLDYNYDYLNLGRSNSIRAGFLILAIISIVIALMSYFSDNSKPSRLNENTSLSNPQS